jgi:hypothetical protein
VSVVGIGAASAIALVLPALVLHFGAGMFTSVFGMVCWWLGMLACTATAWAVMRPRKSLTAVGLVFLCIFIQFLRGGFNLEGNMEEQLTEEAEMWLAAVEAEHRAIEALPFVKSVGCRSTLCSEHLHGWPRNRAQTTATWPTRHVSRGRRRQSSSTRSRLAASVQCLTIAGDCVTLVPQWVGGMRWDGWEVGS